MKRLMSQKFLCTFAISFLISTVDSGAKDNGWILTQRSKIFGEQYLYISTNGVKCLNPKQGIGWITQSPNWNITFFNEKTKLYYSVSYNNWKNKIAKNGLVPANISWSKVTSGNIAGLKATEYQMVNSSSKTTSPNTNTKWVSANYWLADEIIVPATLAQLISNACGLPTSDSIPLQLSYTNQKSNKEVLLTTYNQKAAVIPNYFFNLPVKYKPAKSEVEVLMNQENKALVNELANDLTSDYRQGSSAQNLSLNKLPDKLTLPGGKTVTKDQVTKFLDKFKQSR